MSREIKFRCWDQKDKKYLLPEKQSFVILPTMPSFGVTLPYENRSNPDNIDEDCIDWADADLLMGRYELEQYTGLKDKNGEEICEGDIVRYSFINPNRTYTEPVSFGPIQDGEGYYHQEFLAWRTTYVDDGEAHSSLLDLVEPNWTCEIIGNVHENPGLLGGEE